MELTQIYGKKILKLLLKLSLKFFRFKDFNNVSFYYFKMNISYLTNLTTV